MVPGDEGPVVDARAHTAASEKAGISHVAPNGALLAVLGGLAKQHST